MYNIDNIAREIYNKQTKIHGNPYCPYGKIPTYDDLWENEKEKIRKHVKEILEIVNVEKSK